MITLKNQNEYIHDGAYYYSCFFNIENDSIIALFNRYTFWNGGCNIDKDSIEKIFKENTEIDLIYTDFLVKKNNSIFTELLSGDILPEIPLFIRKKDFTTDMGVANSSNPNSYLFRKYREQNSFYYHLQEPVLFVNYDL